MGRTMARTSISHFGFSIWDCQVPAPNPKSKRPEGTRNPKSALIARSFFCLLLALLGGVAWAAPALSVSPNRLSFALQQVGTSSSPQTATLTNTGDANVRV